MTPNERAYIEATPTVHDLIIVAIEELEKHEQLQGYRIRMDVYHDYNSRGDYCHVCLGGAFLAGAFPENRQTSFEIVSRIFTNDKQVSLAFRRRMRALDSFRIGYIDGALGRLEITATKYEDFAFLVNYYQCPELFKTQMLCLAEYFREMDLKIP